MGGTTMDFATIGKTRMTAIGLCIAMTAACLAAPAASAQLYSETVSGDLSNNASAPTNLGTLALGSNFVFGATIPSGPIVNEQTGELAIQDPDYLTFTVGGGQALTGLTFGAGTLIEPADRLFIGIAQGASVNVDFSRGAAGLLGWTLVPATMIGQNVLPALGQSAPPDFPSIPGATGFSGPLSSGTYSLWLLDGDRSVTYTLNLQTAAVPEAATWAMMIVGFGCVGVATRRGAKPRRARSLG